MKSQIINISDININLLDRRKFLKLVSICIISRELVISTKANANPAILISAIAALIVAISELIETGIHLYEVIAELENGNYLCVKDTCVHCMACECYICDNASAEEVEEAIEICPAEALCIKSRRVVHNDNKLR